MSGHPNQDPQRPEPQKLPQAAQPTPTPSPTPGPAPRQPSGPYYSPPPTSQQPPPRPQPRFRQLGLAALAAVALGLSIWYATHRPAQPQPPPPAAAQQQADTILLLSDADADHRATDHLRSLLAGPSPTEARADGLNAANAEALQTLDRDSAEMAEDLQTGRRVLYRLRLLDFLVEDGDEVTLSVDGVGLGPVSLSNTGTEILIPLAQGKPARVKVVATGDGGGGVTFGVVSSLGEARTRVMQVGDSEQWQVTVK